MIKYAYFALFFTALHAAEIEDTLSQAEKMPVLKAVVLTDKVSDKISSNESGFVAKAVDIPNGIKQLKNQLSDSFIGKPLTDELISDLQKELMIYFKDQGTPFTAVCIPDQKVQNGILQVQINESQIDEIICSNNNWFSNRCITRKAQLKKGDRLCCEKIMNDLAWLDRNPFIHAEAVFSPGKDPYTTNVELKVNDRCPFEVFIGADNTGTDYTGNARIFAGATWGNAFNRGDILSYQFSTTNKYSKYYAHFGQYIAFLPWKNSLNLYGGYSRTCPDITDFTSQGVYTQVSARYTIPLMPLYKPPFHEFAFGVDYKNTNNNLNFIGDDTIPVISEKIVNLFQFVGSYTYGNICGCHEISFNAELFWSPGKILDHQSDANYNSLRAGADASYVYGRVALSDIWQLPCCFKAYGLLRGQLASETLLPSEQFGIGGYDTVRGYDEREYNGDDAVVLNLELRSPDLRYCCNTKYFNKHRIFFLTFLDYGYGHQITVIEGQDSSENLISLGLGLRYFMCDKLSFRADYGFKLRDTKLGGSSLGKFHLGGFLTF